MTHDTYFLGYDAREHEAACIAAYSLIRRANRRTRIYLVEHQMLRALKKFDREWKTAPSGQMSDLRDGRPFSTAFSHTRFLVFNLASDLRCTGPCMFLDCDWLFQDDPGVIMAQQEKNPDKIGVVSRHREIDEGSTKMDGMVQQGYHRKLWSAMFTFMPTPEWSALFDVESVNSKTGRDLHGFLGLDKDRFWEIEPEWHYIPSLDPEDLNPKGIHYSEFSPWLNPDRYSEFPAAFDAWTTEKAAWLDHASRRGSLEVWDNLGTDLAAARA